MAGRRNARGTNVPDVGEIRTNAAISLADELEGLAETLEAAQLIAELLATHAMPDDAAVSRAPKMLESVLSMAVGRVRLLRKVVAGAADVRLLLCRRNHALARHPGDDPDVVLSARRK